MKSEGGRTAPTEVYDIEPLEEYVPMAMQEAQAQVRQELLQAGRQTFSHGGCTRCALCRRRTVKGLGPWLRPCPKAAGASRPGRPKDGGHRVVDAVE